MQVKRLAVFVSGTGSNFLAVCDAIEKENIPAKIALVISSSAKALALNRAAQKGISTAVVDRATYPEQEQRQDAILSLLKDYNIDYCILAGYLAIVGPRIIQEYRNRIINIHPSLIPSFCGQGYYGKRVHQAVLDYGAKISGATVHFVDEGTDTGPIILQKSVKVQQDDTAETLAARVLKVEHELLPKAVDLLCRGKLQVVGRRVIINQEGVLS